MNVTLTPELERLVDELVRSGLYADPDDVMRAALRHLLREEERDRLALDRLRAEIDIGLEDLRMGRSVQFETPEDMRSLLDRL